MIYSSNNILLERNQVEMKLSVALEKIKKMIKGEQMDTKKINKLIREIELCNKKIKNYRDAESGHEKNRIRNDLELDKEVIAKETRELLWVFPACGAFLAATTYNPVLGAIVSSMYVMLVRERLSIDNFYKKLEDENNKALKWLKEERDVIEFKNGRKNSEIDSKDDKVKNESNIFESVKLI